MSYCCTDGRCGMCRCYIAELDTPSSACPELLAIPRLRECLACQTRLRTDCLVEIPDADEPVVLPFQSAKGRVKAIEPLSAHAVRVRIETERIFQYRGGQHFELGFTGHSKRYYSAGPSSLESELAFHVQIHPNGAVSQYVRQQLQVGDGVRVRGPMGSAYLRRKDPSALMLASSGTGLGGLLSVLGEIADAQLTNPVHVYAGFAFSEEVYGRDDLAVLTGRIRNMRKCEVVVASGPLQRGERRGLLTHAISKDLGGLTGTAAYLFGTPSAVEATSRIALDKGLSPRRLRAVPFHPVVTLDSRI